jgi:hypothetical protein
MRAHGHAAVVIPSLPFFFGHSSRLRTFSTNRDDTDSIAWMVVYERVVLLPTIHDTRSTSQSGRLADETASMSSCVGLEATALHQLSSDFQSSSVCTHAPLMQVLTSFSSSCDITIYIRLELAQRRGSSTPLWYHQCNIRRSNGSTPLSQRTYRDFHHNIITSFQRLPRDAVAV